jgi:hypothetical protein
VVTMMNVLSFNILPSVHVRLFLVSWGGVRLSLLETSANNWPIVPAPVDK